MTTLEHALAELHAARTELLAPLNGMDEAKLERPGALGAWSVKNVLAHLAAWEDWVVQALPVRMATGTTPPEFRARVADEDQFNALGVAERAELTPSEQLMELERVRAELLRYVHTLPPADLARRQPWPEWAGTLPEYRLVALGQHERDHAAALRAALPR